MRAWAGGTVCHLIQCVFIQTLINVPSSSLTPLTGSTDGRAKYDTETKQVFLQLTKRFYSRTSKVSDIVNRITTYCCGRGPEGKRIYSIPPTTKRTWVEKFIKLMKEGKEEVALGLVTDASKKRGPKPVLSVEVRG